MSDEKQKKDTPTIVYEDEKNNFKIEKSIYEIPEGSKKGEKRDLITIVKVKKKWSEQIKAYYDARQFVTIPLECFTTFVESIKNSK